ncbi:hypothetical protein ABPG72_014099 [Tetrahymena utriculariae]
MSKSKLDELRIRESDAFKNLQDAYESVLQMKTDLVHSRISAGLSHGLAIGFLHHLGANPDKDQYLAPTLLGAGSNQFGQLGKQINTIYSNSQDKDRFEKIFLVHNQEEYYPIQVCCGYSFSLILAIEGKNLQWLDKLTQAKAEKYEKSEYLNIKQEMFQELLSKTKIFFTGEIGIHQEDNAAVIKSDKKRDFLRHPTKLKTRVLDRNSLRIDLGSKYPTILDNNQLSEQDALLGNIQEVPNTDENNFSDDDDDDDENDGTKTFSNREQEIKLEEKNYKYCISDVVQLPKAIGGRKTFVVQICCGFNFCLVLTYNFQVLAWGDNSYGNIGTGDLDYQEKPKIIQFEENRGDDSRIQFISCGANHCAAVSLSGKLYTWGQGIQGQLGHQNVMNLSIPTVVKGELQEKKVVFVSCGGGHTICLTNEGYAYSFGNNKNGQLGLGDQEQRNVPVKIQKLQNYFIVNIVCGMNNTFIFTQVGKIFACGSNQHNKLGLDQLFYQRDNFLNPIDLDINFLKGVNNPNLKDVYIYQIAASPHFTYALSNQGLLTTWGLQVNDCLGRNIDSYISEKMKNLNKNRTNMLIPCASKFRNCIDQYTTYHKFYYPIQNSTIFRASEKDFISNDIVDIELGVFHTMALTNAGEIYIWGSNQMCQHGCISNIVRQEYDDTNEKKINIIQNDISKETLPSVVTFFNIKENRRITYIAAGYEYCMAIENKRLVYAWGRNTDGQLGIGKTQYYVESPQMVLGLEGNLMKSIACGENHTLFLTDTGQVYSCGSSKDGKLGLGNRTNTQLQPQLINNLSKVEQVACGQSHSMALAQDDFFKQDDDDDHARQINVKMVIYTWGNAWESKLGHGDRENLYEPTKIQSNYLFKFISAGSHHSAALTTDDSLVVWGPYKYFGHTKPDENIKGKKVVSTQHEYHEFMKPTLHPKITEKVRHVCLGDKTTFIVAKKDNKIYQYGIFETDFKELLKIHKNNNEHILEKILPFRGGTGDQEYYEVPVNEIKKISVSKDHVAVIGKNQVYTWGYDNLTGRLGHGYMFKDTNKNQIENVQNEEQAEADQRQKPQHDLTKKLEKPEYCNYINKYLQEQLKIFQKKQQQGTEDEEANDSSDDGSDPRAEEEKGVEDQHKEDKRHTKNFHQKWSLQGTNVYSVKSVTVISNATNDTRQQTLAFNRDNQQRQNTVKSKKALTIVPNQSFFLINNKQNNQQLYEQFFQNPINVKSTYERLTARDKPDLYSILSEQYGLLNEERILYVYDKVTALSGEIFLKYQSCQQHLNHNKVFKRAAQSQVLKRIASQPFSIAYSEKNSNVLLKQDQYQPFLSNKFYYKKLFTLMQIHPCYLIKIYEKKMDKDQFIQLVKETFGELENSVRKQRLYTELCKKILSIDLKENNSIKDSRKPLVLNTDKNTSFSYVFVKLFIHFYESMSDLIKLNRKFRLKVIKTLEDLIQSNSSKYQVQEDLFVLDRKYIAESGDYYKTDEQIKEQLDRNQNSVKEYLQHFFKDREFLQAQSSQKVVMCEKLRELISFAIEYIQQKRPFEIIENIQYCILGIIIQSMLDSCQSLYSNKNGSNFEWIIKAIKMYIYLDENDKKNQDINIFIEYIKQQDDERSKIYEILVGKPFPKKQIAYYNFIQDIYSHSIENQDDYALISLSTLEKLTKFVQRVNIQFNPKEDEDFFLKCCKSLKDEQPNFITSTVEKQHEHLKVKIKLETRQLFYSSNQFLKKCNDCETILQRDFLRSNDRDVKEQFQMFNPSSLESCIVKLVQVITKQNYDDLLTGKQQIQHLCSKFIAKLQNKTNKDGKNLVQSIQIVKNFSKAFENAYELEYSNESQSEKLIIPSDLSKQVLKNLINRIDNQINQVVKYYNKMETLFRVYFSIKAVLDKFISNIDVSKSQQFKIITNSYYGIANRDLEKVIERDPIAITSKISGSIHGMDLSTFLYENIDVFSNKKLNNIKEDYQNNKIKDHFIQLNMFGEYSIYQLKQKGVIKYIDDEVVDILKTYLPNNNNLKSKQRQKKDIKSDIEKCLFYIFNDYGNKYVSVDVVYKGGEISILTILCGLKGSKELRIDHFRIDRDTILSLRKQRIREDISKQTIKYGFTTFQKNQLLKLLEKMEDHYSVYEYIYSSNNCTV